MSTQVMGLGSLRFIICFADYRKKSVNWSNPVYTSITEVYIEFIPYNLFFCNLLYKWSAFYF